MSETGNANQKISENNFKELVDGYLHCNHLLRTHIVHNWGKSAGKEVVPFLIEALKNEQSTVRQHAVIALGPIGDERALKPLINALKDESPHVRMNTAVALGELNNNKAVIPLIQSINEDISYVQRAAVDALAEIKDKRAVQLLIKIIFDKNKDSYVQEAAMRALGKIGDKKAVVPLLDVFSDLRRTESIRKAAVEGLGELKDDRALEPLIKAFNHKDKFFRAIVVWALGKIDSEKALNIIFKALDDPDEYVQECAVESLGLIKSKKTLAPLLRALNADSEELRKVAWKSFSQSYPELSFIFDKLVEVYQGAKLYPSNKTIFNESIIRLANELNKENPEAATTFSNFKLSFWKKRDHDVLHSFTREEQEWLEQAQEDSYGFAEVSIRLARAINQMDIKTIEFLINEKAQYSLQDSTGNDYSAIYSGNRMFTRDFILRFANSLIDKLSFRVIAELAYEPGSTWPCVLLHQRSRVVGGPSPKECQSYLLLGDLSQNTGKEVYSEEGCTIGKLEEITSKPDPSKCVRSGLFPGLDEEILKAFKQFGTDKLPISVDVSFNYFYRNGVNNQQRMLRYIEIIISAYPPIKLAIFSEVDKEICNKYNVTTFPTLDVIYREQLIRRIVGFYPLHQIKELLDPLFKDQDKD